MMATMPSRVSAGILLSLGRMHVPEADRADLCQDVLAEPDRSINAING